MKKPDALKRLLLHAVPQLAAAPERLQIFIDEGRVAARAGVTLSFEYRYRLDLVVQDFAGDRTALFVPILAWLAEAQPDLLQRENGEPFTFESEVLDDDTADVSIRIDLTEPVLVQPAPGGGYAVRYLDEPGDPDRFEDVCGVNLWQLFLRDQLIAQGTPPAPAP